jgi:hypothetical protein
VILTPRGRAAICILPLPDVHAHFTSEPHWSKFLDLAGRNRNDITDVVNIGDWGDYSWASEHPRSEAADAYSEYRCMARQSDQLWKALGKRAGRVRWHWMDGNHEYRIDPTNPKSIARDLIIRPENTEWKASFARWRRRPYVFDRRGILRIGNTAFFHGAGCGRGSDRLEGLRMWSLLGGPRNLLTVRGHTHTVVVPQPVEITAATRGTQWMFNPGHLGPAKPRYATKENTTTWGTALSLIRQWGNELPRVQYEIIR